MNQEPDGLVLVNNPTVNDGNFSPVAEQSNGVKRWRDVRGLDACVYDRACTVVVGCSQRDHSQTLIRRREGATVERVSFLTLNAGPRERDVESCRRNRVVVVGFHHLHDRRGACRHLSRGLDEHLRRTVEDHHFSGADGNVTFIVDHVDAHAPSAAIVPHPREDAVVFLEAGLCPQGIDHGEDAADVTAVVIEAS